VPGTASAPHTNAVERAHGAKTARSVLQPRHVVPHAAELVVPEITPAKVTHVTTTAAPIASTPPAIRSARPRRSLPATSRIGPARTIDGYPLWSWE
jgi:hypothetical protein